MKDTRSNYANTEREGTAAFAFKSFTLFEQCLWNGCLLLPMRPQKKVFQIWSVCDRWLLVGSWNLQKEKADPFTAEK